MKYLIAAPILIMISCNGSDENIFELEQISREDSIRQATTQFLDHPQFKDRVYQTHEFKKIEGLWSCLKILQHKSNQVKFPKYSDLLFSESKVWPLDYPCSWTNKSFNNDVFFRNDSIFLSNQNRINVDGFQIKLCADTLILTGIYETTYYIRKPFDPLILADLKEREFNEKCFENTWKLTEISDGGSEFAEIQDGFMDHVPRKIDFSSGEFVVEGIYLINSKNRDIMFKITQYDRHFDEIDGENSFLEIREIMEIDGTNYCYYYEPITD